MESATPTVQVLNILVLVLVLVRTITMTSTSTRKRQRLFHAVRPHVANPVIKTHFSNRPKVLQHLPCVTGLWQASWPATPGGKTYVQALRGGYCCR
jgi:hypothetical protein